MVCRLFDANALPEPVLILPIGSLGNKRQLNINQNYTEEQQLYFHSAFLTFLYVHFTMGRSGKLSK